MGVVIDNDFIVLFKLLNSCRCVITILSLYLNKQQPVPSADFVVSVDIEGVQHQVYVQKRPHVDEFLKRMGEMFECVLFTASLAKVYSHNTAIRIIREYLII